MKKADQIAVVQTGKDAGMNMGIIAVSGNSDADLPDVRIFVEQRADKFFEAFVGHILKPDHILRQAVAEEIVDGIEQITLAAYGRGKNTADVHVVFIVNIVGSRPSEFGGDAAQQDDFTALIQLVDDIACCCEAEAGCLGNGVLREFGRIQNGVANQLDITFFDFIYGADFIHDICLSFIMSNNKLKLL